MAQCFFACEAQRALNLGGSHADHPLCQDCFKQVGQNCPCCDRAYTPAERTRITAFIAPAPQGPPMQMGLPPQQAFPTPSEPGYPVPPMPYMQPGYPTPSMQNRLPGPGYPVPPMPYMQHGYQAPSPVPSRPALCTICNRQPTDPVKMTGCGHVFCKAELIQQLTTQAAKSKEVKCPDPNCKAIATPFFLMIMLDSEAFQTYRLKHLHSIIVICPNCSVIEEIEKKHRIVCCSNCETRYCSRCAKKAELCHCLPPEEMTCRVCFLLMNSPGRHKKMVCGNCNAITCTYCEGADCACNHNALTAVTRIDDVVECSICGLYISIDSLDNIISMEDCRHVYHKECIQDYVEATLESGKFSKQLKCPDPKCMGTVGNFQSLVSTEQWDMYNQRLLETSFKIIQCPKCLESFAVDGDEQHVTCPHPKCNLAFCLQCKEPPHEGSCSRSNILNRIKDMEAAGYQVSQCPGCKLPYLKDEHCQHVKCMNPSCGVEFCFTCSCLRKPTTAHCNAWHRPGCDFYNEVGVAEEKKRGDCPECQRLGRLCDPPKRLRVPCRFDEDEV